jgi:glutamyl-tRNA synthetase
MPALKERAKTLIELTRSANFLYKDGPQTPDQDAVKLLTDDARKIIAKVRPILAATDWSSSASLEQVVRNFAVAEGLKLGQVAQPLRAAITGQATSPPLFDMLALLGREESLTRLGAYAT